MSDADLDRQAFLLHGGSPEQYEHWRRTRSTEPGGLLIVERWEAEQAAEWLGVALDDLDGVVWVG